MLAICFVGTKKVAVQTLNDPVLEKPEDAIVKVHYAGLCGSDLHPYFGRELGLDSGTVMGHEFVGEVVEVGAGVRSIRRGDMVFSPFTTSCGECYYCVRDLSARCVKGQLFGWRSGGKGLHGAQAALVRVPLADGTLVRMPDEMPLELGLLLGDNLATGYYCASMAQIKADGCYLVIGCGTVGLLCIAAAKKLGAEKVLAYDPNPEQRKIAESFGATAFSSKTELAAALARISEGRGADAVMEVVGLPEAQRLAYDMLRPGGIMSVVGCHCSTNFAFSPVDAFDKNLTYRTGRCPARSLIPKVTKLFADQQQQLLGLMTHRFSVADGEVAYDVFANRKDGCVKAIIDFTIA